MILDINGRSYQFTGPVDLEVFVCPVCRSSEIVDVKDQVDEMLIAPDLRDGVTCLECGAVFVDEGDLNREMRRYDEENPYI